MAAGSFAEADLSALGPLEPFARSGPVTDLFVNGEQGLWIDRGSGAEYEPGWTADEAEVRALAVRLIARGGRHIDEATPAVDVRLGRGIRVHAVLPPVSARGTLLSVRVPRAAGFSVAALARAGMLDSAQAGVLGEAVAARKNLLVTGAGGSIGAELCRQLAALGADALVLLDHTEGGLFETERELVHERGFAPVVPLLADAKNLARVREVFERYRPGVVFHAAAYKHVPLLEANPVEAVRNNVVSTRVLAEVASEFGTKRFVLVSTDKAVKPKTILGQSKAVCEWIVSAAAARERNGTHFISVRFGNVLGTSGSVIPIFRRQIAKGGPVTVTHPEMTRYFMTVPEAAQLIVQAGALGESGDIFVLDMGTPVKILELAQNMIRLSGREPDRDIPIEFIGVRPGEKLHEELWAADERGEPTRHPKILRCTAPPVDPGWLDDELAELDRLVEAGEMLELVAKLNELTKGPTRTVVEAREPV